MNFRGIIFQILNKPYPLHFLVSVVVFLALFFNDIFLFIFLAHKLEKLQIRLLVGSDFYDSNVITINVTKYASVVIYRLFNGKTGYLFI